MRSKRTAKGPSPKPGAPTPSESPPSELLPPEPPIPAETDAAPSTGLPLPSPVAGTNVVIADIVLRAAGGLLISRMEKGLLRAGYDPADAGRVKAERMVDGRSIAASAALWAASRLATRSPLGLALVAGGLAAKVFYDRGKALEARRRVRKQSHTPM